MVRLVQEIYIEMGVCLEGPDVDMCIEYDDNTP